MKLDVRARVRRIHADSSADDDGSWGHVEAVSQTEVAGSGLKSACFACVSQSSRIGM
jgi:hypothetical protein